MDGVSNQQATNAGQVSRDYVFGKSNVAIGSPELDDALDVVIAFRREFSVPLLVSLRVLGRIVADVSPESVDGVAGRPKRLGAIAAKLARLPHLRLAQMEDIAGCRARLPDQDAVWRVLARVKELWPDASVDDYVTNPKSTGYRAIHVVVQESGRRVEIQLRTPGQHRWADTVEEWGERLGLNTLGRSLKDGQGPAELVEYFERAAYRIAVEEKGGDVDEDFKAAFAALRERVRHYFRDQR